MFPCDDLDLACHEMVDDQFYEGLPPLSLSPSPANFSELSPDLTLQDFSQFDRDELLLQEGFHSEF
jgi:hypothetical protein